MDLNRLLSEQFAGLEGLMKTKGIDAILDLMPGLPLIQADEQRLNQAFENLIKHAIVSTPAGEKLSISSSRLGDRVVIHLRHKVRRLSEDDLDKFFFPHIEEAGEWTIMDLPLSQDYHSSPRRESGSFPRRRKHAGVENRASGEALGQGERIAA